MYRLTLTNSVPPEAFPYSGHITRHGPAALLRRCRARGIRAAVSGKGGPKGAVWVQSGEGECGGNLLVLLECQGAPPGLLHAPVRISLPRMKNNTPAFCFRVKADVK